MPTLPNFLVIGAAKCGTTTLCALLAEHPDVFLHHEKELNFFCFDELYAKGLDHYAASFEGARGEAAIGEGSPNYTKHVKHPKSAERIAAALPDARLLYIVRHPLRRMESAWLHARRSGHRSFASFTKTVRRMPSYVDTSDYGRQLEIYRAHFPDSQIKVLFLDDLQSDPHSTMKEVFEYVGVDPSFRVESSEERRNVSAGRRVDTAVLRAARRLPGLSALERKLPKGYKRFRKRWLRKELVGPPAWDAATRAWVVEQLRAPTARFLEAHGKPADLWDWER